METRKKGGPPERSPSAPTASGRPAGEILLYRTDDGRTRIECRFADETLWLSQALIAELFQKDVRTINEHLKNLFREGELAPEATIRNFRIVRREGSREVTRQIEHYNLGAGYRSARRAKRSFVHGPLSDRGSRR